ncbi:unnamed protein product [Brachionus calyciflorus]|uniref:C2H2-type domain-containing protein n=1 Tax=Brachionus calyciflorus TaxID=104777 RepID=A0A814LA58_9BILA|nr:unnamed protein product [Brachionus calyciflorus]
MNFNQKLSDGMIISLYSKLRQACSLKLDKENLTLGGIGRIVEIDESLYCKVKHHKGKDLKRDPLWVFGLVERSIENKNSKCYMQKVDDREASTLCCIIYDKCANGSIIYSDSWASYSKLSTMKNFIHKKVNHSINFIDPESDACTNRIESLWRACKQKFKDMNGCKRVYVQSYLDEYVWRFNNGVSTNRVCYELILNALASLYKPGNDFSHLEKLLEDEEMCFSEEIYFSDASSESSGQDDVESDILSSLTGSDYGNIKEFELEDNLDLVSSENIVNVEDSVSGSSTKQLTIMTNNPVSNVYDGDSENDADEVDGNIIFENEANFVQDESSEKVNISIHEGNNVRSSDEEKYRRRYHTTISDRVEAINNKLETISLSSVKYKSLQYAIDSLNEPKSSKETLQTVNKHLCGKKNPVECPHCGNYFEMGKGLKLHISKKH